MYLTKPTTVPTGVQFAAKALAAYGRIDLAAGQTSTVALHIPLRQLQYWSDVSGWTTTTGTRGLQVGPSERSTTLNATVTITADSTVTGYIAPNNHRHGKPEPSVPGRGGRQPQPPRPA